MRMRASCAAAALSAALFVGCHRARAARPSCPAGSFSIGYDVPTPDTAPRARRCRPRLPRAPGRDGPIACRMPECSRPGFDHRPDKIRSPAADQPKSDSADSGEFHHGFEQFDQCPGRDQLTKTPRRIDATEIWMRNGCNEKLHPPTTTRRESRLIAIATRRTTTTSGPGVTIGATPPKRGEPGLPACLLRNSSRGERQFEQFD